MSCNLSISGMKYSRSLSVVSGFTGGITALDGALLYFLYIDLIVVLANSLQTPPIPALLSPALVFLTTFSRRRLTTM